MTLADELQFPDSPFNISPEELIEERQKYTQEVSDKKKAIKDIDLRLGALMDLRAIRMLPYQDWEAYRTLPREPVKSIDPIKLLELGVPASWIEQATVEGKRGEPGITVRRSKTAKEASNEDQTS